MQEAFSRQYLRTPACPRRLFQVHLFSSLHTGGFFSCPTTKRVTCCFFASSTIFAPFSLSFPSSLLISTSICHYIHKSNTISNSSYIYNKQWRVKLTPGRFVWDSFFRVWTSSSVFTSRFRFFLGRYVFFNICLKCYLLLCFIFFKNFFFNKTMFNIFLRTLN